jgi:hypothetical protein
LKGEIYFLIIAGTRESPRAGASDGFKRDVERVPHGDAPTPRLEGGKIITKKNKKQRGIFSEVFIF